MTKTIKVKVEDLTADWVRQLQQAHQNATLEISVHEAESSAQMTEDTFWSIIDLLDWKRGDDTEAIMEPAINRLQQYDVEDIFRFQDLLAEKLFALDRQIFAENLGERRYGGERHFSADSFLYARACVVANGKDFYESVLKDPTNMPKEFTFEGLLYLAPEAFQRKTGKDWDYLPTPSYETFSNRSGWGGKSWMDTISEV